MIDFIRSAKTFFSAAVPVNRNCGELKMMPAIGKEIRNRTRGTDAYASSERRAYFRTATYPTNMIGKIILAHMPRVPESTASNIMTAIKTNNAYRNTFFVSNASSVIANPVTISRYNGNECVSGNDENMRRWIVPL